MSNFFAPTSWGLQAPVRPPEANTARVTYTPNGIAREPGFFNSSNPFDTGRAGETNRELNQGQGGKMEWWDYEARRPRSPMEVGSDGLYVFGTPTGGGAPSGVGGGGGFAGASSFLPQLTNLLNQIGPDPYLGEQGATPGPAPNMGLQQVPFAGPPPLPVVKPQLPPVSGLRKLMTQAMERANRRRRIERQVRG